MRSLAVACFVLGVLAITASSIRVCSSSNANQRQILVSFFTGLLAAHIDDPYNTTVLAVRWTSVVGFDAKQNKVIWSENDDSSSDQYAYLLKRANVDGTELEVLTTEYAFIAAIAVDPVTGNMYYFNRGKRELTVCDNYAQNCSILQNDPEVTTIDGIALNPVDGTMFWTENGWLHKAGMDLSNKTRLLYTGTGSLALDIPNSRIYWTEFSAIKSANLDGTDTITFRRCSSLWECAHNGIGLNDGIIYFGGSTGPGGASGVVQSIDTREESYSTQFVMYTPSTILDLTIFGSADTGASLRTNTCEGKQCSHLCVLANQSFKCLCPENMLLGPDQRTCL